VTSNRTTKEEERNKKEAVIRRTKRLKRLTMRGNSTPHKRGAVDNRNNGMVPKTAGRGRYQPRKVGTSELARGYAVLTMRGKKKEKAAEAPITVRSLQQRSVNAGCFEGLNIRQNRKAAGSSETQYNARFSFKRDANLTYEMKITNDRRIRMARIAGVDRDEKKRGNDAK